MIRMNLTGINNQLPKEIQTKSFADSYLYYKNGKIYEKQLMNYILKGSIIDRKDPSFDDLRYEIKKNQRTEYLSTLIDSPMIKFISSPQPMPKIFKVITAKDIRTDKKPKVFIDVTDILVLKNGKWHCRNIYILISYLLDAATQMVYYSDPKRLLMKDAIISSGASAFSALFTYIVDYLFKITSVTVIRDKCTYLASMYYMINMLGKEQDDSTRDKCMKIADISDKEEEMIYLSLDVKNAFKNISEFIKAVSDYLRLPKLTIDVFLEKWIFVFGTGTQFSLELFPSFSSMLTNVYAGGFLNNQNTIEKIIGRDLTNFCKAVFNVCEQSI